MSYANDAQASNPGNSDSMGTEDETDLGKSISTPDTQTDNTMDFGRGSVSNVTNSSTYSPSFAAMGLMGRGLDPRGLKGFKDTSFSKVGGQFGPVAFNPIQQLDPTQIGRYTDALRGIGQFSTFGNRRSERPGKGALAALGLSGIGALDTMSIDALSAMMAASNPAMSRDNPYGAPAPPGYISTIGQMLGFDMSPSFSMSDKEAAETARGALSYGSVPGQSITDYGMPSGIQNQFSKAVEDITFGKVKEDISNVGKSISSAFSEAIGFMSDPKGGSNTKDSDFNGLMSASATPQSFDMFGGRTNNTSDSMSKDAAYGSLSSKANEKEGYGAPSLGIASLDIGAKDVMNNVTPSNMAQGYEKRADAASTFKNIGKEMTNYIGPDGKELFGNPNLRLNIGVNEKNEPQAKFSYNFATG
tara:strand:- start:45 stop:1292 length:1248 start_codon:yes stop_codon:yes gene_type:complete